MVGDVLGMMSVLFDMDEIFYVGGCVFCLIFGDITALDRYVVAIVSIDDNFFFYGGGVLEVIW